jgi:hypothetical protein
MPYRPAIQMSISRWEMSLILMNIPILLSGVIYYNLNWNNIPVSILLNDKGKIMDKTMWVWLSYFYTSVLSILGFYFILRQPRNTYYKGRSLSQNIHKAKQQYRIESSCLLGNLIILNLLLSVSGIEQIEKQIKRVYLLDNWWVPFLIMMGVVWLIHHILWTRLADK